MSIKTVKLSEANPCWNSSIAWWIDKKKKMNCRGIIAGSNNCSSW